MLYTPACVSCFCPLSPFCLFFLPLIFYSSFQIALLLGVVVAIVAAVVVVADGGGSVGG